MKIFDVKGYVPHGPGQRPHSGDNAIVSLTQEEAPYR